MKGPSIGEVQARVSLIAADANVSIGHRDDESLHARQDALFVDVLRAIASGESEDPATLASAALLVTEVKFERWYA